MKRTLEIIATTLLMLSIALSARAVPLQNLFSGASLTAGDKLFDFWVLELIDASSPTLLPNLSAIDVLPVTDGGNDPGPGLQFQLNNEFTLAPNSAPNAFIDLAFSYRASSLGTALIKDNSLEMTLASVTLAGDNGSLINEFVGTAPGLIDLATEQVEFSFLDGAGLTQTVLDKADFPPRSEVFVQTYIQVYLNDAGPNPPSGNSVALFGFEQRFSQVEVAAPAPLALVAMGLITLVLAGRRRMSGVKAPRSGDFKDGEMQAFDLNDIDEPFG